MDAETKTPEVDAEEAAAPTAIKSRYSMWAKIGGGVAVAGIVAGATYGIHAMCKRAGDAAVDAAKRLVG